jgi:hypothetical protein
MSKCPNCGNDTLQSCERADYCECGYEAYYPDCYSEPEAYEKYNGCIERVGQPNDKR